MKILKESSGQALIIGVLLFITLLLAVPSIVFMNQTIAAHATKTEMKLKGRAVAEEGIAYAMQRLAQTDNWPYEGNGTPRLLPPLTMKSMENRAYQLTFTSAPNAGLESYHVGVLARALDPKGRVLSGSSIFAKISRRTTGARMPRGFSTSAAVELMNSPELRPHAGLHVYFGPIVIHSADPVRLDEVSDRMRRPRKFTEGPITGRYYARAPDMNASPTDQREYWAYNSLGFPSIINTAPGNAFEVRARSGTCPSVTECVSGPCGILQTGCYVEVPPGSVALLDGDLGNPAPWPGYAVAPIPPATSMVLYIKGDAEFRRVTLNVGERGSIIVEGNLKLGDNRDPSGGFDVLTSCPASRCLDLPYAEDCVRIACRSTHYRDMTGFLYVKGDLNVHTARDGWWSMDGTLRVDGKLDISNHSNLELYFNDIANRYIQTANFDIQIDSMTAVP